MNPFNIMTEVAEEIGGEYKVSQRNVPYVVIKYKGEKASVCYFKKTNIFRLFYPYPGDAQEKIDFSSKEELLKHLGFKIK